jgi:GT2 family glycosyltransferase
MISVVINTYNRKEMLFALLRSLYRCRLTKALEIVVVDDCSEELYGPEMKEKFPKVRFFRNNQHQFLIKSRNIGWQLSSGQTVFFVDDDNEIKDRDFFVRAREILEKNSDIGVLGCRTYYFDAPETVLIGPTRFNKMTGKTTFLGQNRPDGKELEGLIETHDNPNAFFTHRSLLEKVGGFTEEIVQTFSEADFAEKVRQAGFKVVQASGLKVYHKSPRVDYRNLGVRFLGGKPERFYFLMRNRFLFIKKWGSAAEFWTYMTIFSWPLAAYYLGTALRTGQKAMLTAGLAGAIDGYYFVFTGKLKNRYEVTN